MFVGVQFKLGSENNQEGEKILALRFIYNRLKEGKKEKEIHKLRVLLKEFESLQNESGSCREANGRISNSHQKAWQVLKGYGWRRGALFFPFRGKVFPRGFSPLKPLLVEEVWERVKSRLVPALFAWAIPRNAG